MTESINGPTLPMASFLYWMSLTMPLRLIFCFVATIEQATKISGVAYK
jgi:hypothetical protein